MKIKKERKKERKRWRYRRKWLLIKERDTKESDTDKDRQGWI